MRAMDLVVPFRAAAISSGQSLALTIAAASSVRVAVLLVRVNVMYPWWTTGSEKASVRSKIVAFVRATRPFQRGPLVQVGPWTVTGPRVAMRGVIVGVVVGLVVVIALVVGVACCCMRRNKAQAADAVAADSKPPKPLHMSATDSTASPGAGVPVVFPVHVVQPQTGSPHVSHPSSPQYGQQPVYPTVPSHNNSLPVAPVYKPQQNLAPTKEDETNADMTEESDIHVPVVMASANSGSAPPSPVAHVHDERADDTYFVDL